MKIINITPTEEHESVIYLMPDTVLHRNNDAFYLPDFSEQITARLAIVIRIQKIGKNIAPKFANRYYNEVSVGLNLEARDILLKQQAKGWPWDEAIGFDNSAPIGTFVPKTENYELVLTSGENTLQTTSISNDDIDQIISKCSKHFTLKIGDFIYISPTAEFFTLTQNQQLKVNLNKNSLLDCHIK